MTRTEEPTAGPDTAPASVQPREISLGLAAKTAADRAARRAQVAGAALLFVVICVIGLGIWSVVTADQGADGLAPTPGATWNQLVTILSDPFYVSGPASVGIFWHLVASLQRVLTGFLIAAAIAIPLGFLLGSATRIRWAVEPFVQVLRPVSPLAWLPLGLALLRDAENTAIFVIVMASLWPMLLNTIEGVQKVDPLYMQLARTLEASRAQVIRTIQLPAALPSILTGLRLSLSTAWLVIIAAEMLVGSRGMGYFVWNQWNRLSVPAILVAILLIGAVGFALDRLVVWGATKIPHG
ncbi:ABC transporter permease [Nocardia mangyaensis]|uniref:ABC transporter permease n=1 Tax=Nocardia mangyaensis TaxID=2213200 RepID=UPI000A0385A1|nr:ABC transporter permease [Nocardia mangyaensis]